MRIRKNKKKEENIENNVQKEEKIEIPKSLIFEEEEYIRWVANENGGRLLVKDVVDEEKEFLTSDDPFQYAVIKKDSELKIKDIVEKDGKVFAKCLSGWIEL